MSSGDDTSYYGIQIPTGTQLPDDLELEAHYTDKVQVLKVLKRLKPARMKKFSTSSEAEEFHRSQDAAPTTEKSGTGVSVESLPFSSLKTQDLTKLRIAIERGNITELRERVESNPRYLVASGDTPTILQERFRYNGIHSAAIKGQAPAAEIILNYITDLEFYARLYPNDSVESRQNRLTFTLDLYLNTPDKGFNETSLHFAAKYGHLSMVQLLVNEPAVEKTRLNKEGQRPVDIVCTRSGTAQDKQKIIQCLQGQVYVPLFRSEADDEAPVVGEPWAPDQMDLIDAEDPFPSPSLDRDILSNITSPIRSAHKYKLPHLHSSPYSPLLKHGDRHDTAEMIVKAMAGPMSPKQAKEFRKSWSSPGTPRKPSSIPASPLRHRLLSDAPRADPFKGLEVVGRSLAGEMNVPWLEYWDFLGCAVDLSEPEGLTKLEEYIRTLETDLKNEDNDVGENVDAEEEIIITPIKFSKTPENIKTYTETSGPQGDVLNTTDDQLASIFDKLTIHSPTSPYHDDQQRHRHQILLDNGAVKTPIKSTDIGISDSPKSAMKTAEKGGATPKRTASEEKVHLESQPCTPSSKRSVIEYMVPSIAVYMDRLRSFWPFGKGGFTPTKHTQTTSTSAESDCDESLSEIPVIESEVTPEELELSVEKETKPRPKVYLMGAKPCKVDRDVLKALESIDISEETYPAVCSWYHNVKSHSSNDQNSWPSPAVIRHRARLRDITEGATPTKTPDRAVGGGYTSSPHRLDDVRTKLSLNY